MKKKELYFDVKSLLKYKEPFNIVIGGRGTGKTYSSLKYVIEHYKETGRRFIFMRRTQTEIEFMAKTESANPMKSVNSEVLLKRVESRFYVFILEDEIIGYAFALSTVSSIRGIDMSDVDVWIFDEFIPEFHVHKIAHEGMAFLNAYETFNRNREFEGKEPMTVFLLANSNNFNSDILVETNLQKKLEEMLRKKKAFSHIEQKRCTVSMLENREFQDKKRNTALYQFAKESEFVGMAIDNRFIENDFSNIKSMSLSGMKIFVSIGDINIFYGNNMYYATCMPVTNGKTSICYGENDAGIKAFRKDYGAILTKGYIYEYLIFENFDIKRRLVKYLTKKEI